MAPLFQKAYPKATFALIAARAFVGATVRLQVRGRGGGTGRDTTDGQRTFLETLLMNQGSQVGARSLISWAKQKKASGTGQLNVLLLPTGGLQSFPFLVIFLCF